MANVEKGAHLLVTDANENIMNAIALENGSSSIEAYTQNGNRITTGTDGYTLTNTIGNLANEFRSRLGDDLIEDLKSAKDNADTEDTKEMTNEIADQTIEYMKEGLDHMEAANRATQEILANTDPETVTQVTNLLIDTLSSFL